jgi:Na+-transporting NADH:ubiquinone oxidoreductase subunit C
MSRDSTVRVLAVAFAVCLACSILVSGAAVGLKQRQDRNKALEKKRNILQIANIYDPAKGVEEQFSRIRKRIVDLETGKFTAAVNPDRFDSRLAARAPGSRQDIPPAKDMAGIRSRSRYMDIYLLEEGGRLQQIILPVYGKGLWSTMYGFIALGPDLSTVTGFGFYEHGETPGLGGEIDNPAWRGKWPGKQVYDQQGQLRLTVVKGAAATEGDLARHQVDGLSGATLTARGVGNLIGYWLGENGYQPFLAEMRKTGGNLP